MPKRQPRSPAALEATRRLRRAREGVFEFKRYVRNLQALRFTPEELEVVERLPDERADLEQLQRVFTKIGHSEFYVGFDRLNHFLLGANANLAHYRNYADEAKNK